MFLIIADNYPLKKQQYFLAILNGISNISIAAAPIVGSYCTKYFHWQGNFYALVIIGVITVIFTLVFIPSTKSHLKKAKLDLRGFLKIISSRDLMLLIFNLNLTSVPYWLFLGISPILYMETLKVSLLHYGYYQGAWALTFALGSIVSSRIINRYPSKKLLFISYWAYIICFLIILLVTYANINNPLLITLAFIPFSLGFVKISGFKEGREGCKRL